MPKFIVYACPVGELAKQIDLFFEKSLSLCGPNQAHSYMPHCTLTGFFEDVSSAVPKYTQKLERSYKRFRRSQPDPAIAVKDISFRPDWHGLELASDWLRKLVLDFACTATSPTRKSPLRPKEWLHLSLAYGFSADHAETLERLARELVDPLAAVEWELRFYQQNPDQNWICHQCLKLESGA
jgi:ubiquitin-associated SH3 domain-containing protein